MKLRLFFQLLVIICVKNIESGNTAAPRSGRPNLSLGDFTPGRFNQIKKTLADNTHYKFKLFKISTLIHRYL